MESEEIEFSDYMQAAKQEFKAILDPLFEGAWEKSGFSFICTVLRVGPARVGHWDPMAETDEAFDDYIRMMNAEMAMGNEKAFYRIGLLTYGHLVEMSSVHDLLFNLLRIHLGEPYKCAPLGYLIRRRRNDPFRSIPASATVKVREIKEKAIEAGFKGLADAIDSFFDDRIRNSFFHSDYCLTEKEYRWTEGGLPSSVEMHYIGQIMARAFAFHQRLLETLDFWLRSLALAPRYQKLSGHVVLELLSKDERLYGFRYHFPNGSVSSFEHTDQRRVFSNMRLRREGGIDLFDLREPDPNPDWRVNGQPLAEIENDGLEE